MTIAYERAANVDPDDPLQLEKDNGVEMGQQDVYNDDRLRRGRRRFGLFLLFSVVLLTVRISSKISYRKPRDAAPHDELSGNSEVLYGCHGGSSKYTAPTLQDFNWTTIIPSSELKWVNCYGRFECGRLEVPLNYAEPEGEKAAVALLKFPSTIPPGKEGYRGPILFNPGGPGGSGVSLLLSRAESLSTIVGDDFDLIGFDPRGIGFTTPGLDPFYSKMEGMIILDRGGRSINASQSALGDILSAADMAGSIVESRAKKVAEHVSTAIVSRDMLSIVKAHGLEKLQYWGFSYGTVLGATFAAMFPDNVGRLIIDGVVDSPNYYEANWSNNLRDTDRELQILYAACVEAGPNVCPMYDKDVASIGTRVNKILETLKTYPVSFYNDTSDTYGIVDYTVTKRAIFLTLYRPYQIGKPLFAALAALEKGNPEPIHELDRGALKKEVLFCDCPRIPPVPFADGEQITLAIACGEGDPVKNGIDEMREFYDKMAQESTFADVWAIHAACSGWKVRSKEIFSGPFEQNTSYPLLIIGNTADPVTPLWNAHKMSKGFKNSVVLTQNSSGHCSLSGTSICTTKAVRAYFRNGTLPEEGTICEVVSSVYGEDLTISTASLSEEEIELLQASRDLEKAYPIFVPRFF